MRDRRVWLSLLPAAGIGAMLWLRAGVPLAANPPATKAARATPTPKPPNKASPAAISARPVPEPTTDAPKVQEKVTIGVYLKELPEIDVKTNTYTADFYLWFRWKGALDPTKTWEFVNVIEPNNTSKVAVYTDDEKGEPKADTLPDGTQYQVFHVQGKFTHPFNLKDYPFDEQDVAIDMEDAEHGIGEIVYEIDHEQTAFEPHISVPGWELREVRPTVSESVYHTNFGDPRVTPGEDKYSRFSFAVHIGRPITGYMVKTVLPIAIVILITFVAFFIGSQYFEARLGLGITSLISAVALQLTAVSDLPSIGYMVLLDKIYNISYAVILLTLIESVVSVKLHDAGKEGTSRLLDRISFAALFLLFFGGIAASIAFR